MLIVKYAFFTAELSEAGERRAGDLNRILGLASRAAPATS